ncbi:MAG: lipopolysaccharide heptosyltransferase I [Desulfuromonadaceae bacterium]|nr:lipopolysaccharide heptosyltransferase I [Desulfuromonadaceae bacterium]
MKILIVKVSALGDVIHALPVLAYIKQLYPDAHIDWLVEESFAPILEKHPLLHQVIRVNTRAWRNMSFRAMMRQICTFGKDLRRQRYDYIFDLQGNSKSALFTLLSKGGDKYGFSRHAVRELPNILATRHRIQPSPEEQHVARRALAVVKAALPGGGEVPLCGPLHIEDKHKKQIERSMDQLEWDSDKVIILHYGTTWDTKLWHLSMWQQLAAKLLQRPNTRVVLTWGSNDELRAAEQIRDYVAEEVFIWPRVSLPEFAALLARADLVVGCDTGPVHIAAAAGTPTVSMYRVTDALRNGPEGEKHIRLQTPMPCAKCLRKQCEYDAQCSTSIRVADVFDAIEKIIE